MRYPPPSPFHPPLSVLLSRVFTGGPWRLLAITGHPVMEFQLLIQKLLSFQQVAQIKTAEPLGEEKGASGSVGGGEGSGAKSKIDLGYPSTTTYWSGPPRPFPSGQ